MIKLNSISNSNFEVPASEYGGNKARADIVSVGRLLATEHFGRSYNAIKTMSNQSADYTARIDNSTYTQTNENFRAKRVLFAAKMACAQTGEDAPETYDDFLRDQRKYMTNSTFLATLSGIDRDIVTPLLPAFMSNALDWLCATDYVGMGKTKEIVVASNDVFLFQDDSWGASRSKPSNYLYDQTLTVNPKPRTAKATIKWYQLIGNGADMGRYYASISAGMYNKIVALWQAQLTAGLANTAFTPTALVEASNNSANWVGLIKKVSEVNNTSRRNVVAFGDLAALTKALPAGVVNSSTVNLDAALATMLGIEWAKYGYLAEYMGAKLMPIDNVIVPGTQNSSITELLPTNKIYFASISGSKPVHVAFEEGTPITIELDPHATADMSIDVTVTASMDAVAVFGSKIAVLTV